MLIKEAVGKMPYFTIENLASLEKNLSYLRVLFCRLMKSGKIISLKRGIYVDVGFIDEIKRRNLLNEYVEFIGGMIYSPSYLSAEYVLEKQGVLPETLQTITLVSAKKTRKIFNQFGLFRYYHIRPALFDGFEIFNRESGFPVARASLAKALFDFLYFRKNILSSREQVSQLRLNLNVLKKEDWKELEKYVRKENSEKMRKILQNLIEIN